MPLYTTTTVKHILAIKCPKQKEKLKVLIENNKGNVVYRTVAVTGMFVVSLTELLFG